MKRAYDLACSNFRSRGKIYILGKLVHNDDVCRDLKKRGIKEIKSLSQIKNGTIILTAHGVGPSLYEKAAKKGLKVVDTTCPKVMKAQRLAQSYAKKNWEVIIFGDKNHKEVKGIKEWSQNEATIIKSLQEAKKIKLSKDKSYCLISQTTQSIEEFEKIVDYFNKKLENFIYFNTICDSTNKRQAEIKKMAKANGIVIVIGGRDSANSNRLYEISKKINPKTFFVENAGQLNKDWFKSIKKIAISAGASTPEWVIKKIVEKIKQFK